MNKIIPFKKLTFSQDNYQHKNINLSQKEQILGK